MRRWLSWLLERTALVQTIQQEVKLLAAERDRLMEDFHRHIFAPPGVSSLRDAYDALVREYKDYLKPPRGLLSMSASVTEHTLLSDKVFRTTISPAPRTVQLSSIDCPGPVGRRIMAERMAEDLIAHLRKTLSCEIAKQLESK
jgi:hypothetical protein